MDRLKSILKIKGYDTCKDCGRKLDQGDVAWNEACTEYGTPFTVIEIQCLKCETEAALVRSWHWAESLDEVVEILEDELDAC